MKKTRTVIIAVLLIMLVGFAAVSTTLVLNGTAIFGTNDDDFDVIFTRSIIDGVDVSDTTISEDGKSLTFSTGDLAIKGDASVLNFTVTNNSTQYDANVTMECSAEGENAAEYYTITNTIPEVVEAKNSIDGSVTATLKKSSVESITETFTCTITATAVERDTIGEEIDPYAIGTEVTLAGENFNIISSTEDTVTMLAQYNLGTDYKQTENTNYVNFSDTSGWEYTPGPKEIDIEVWSTNPKVYVNEYVTYLQGEIKDNSITGNLITLSELKTLGCTINDDYKNASGLTCANSSNASWLVNGQYWWTRSARPNLDSDVWGVASGGSLRYGNFDNDYGVRPVITISKSAI